MKTKSAKLKLERIKLTDLKSQTRNPRQHAEPGTPAWERIKISGHPDGETLTRELLDTAREIRLRSFKIMNRFKDCKL